MSGVSDIPGVSGILDNIPSVMEGMYVGFSFATCLLGITILQAWNYANNNRDSWPLRVFVAVMVVLDIATSVSIAILINTYLIRHFGDYLDFLNISSGIAVETLLTVTVGVLSQLFFASRVYLLNPENYWVPGFVAITAVLGFGFNLFTVIDLLQHPQVSDLSVQVTKIIVGFEGGMVAVSDGVATIALCLNFIKARSSSHTERTNTLLQRLLAFTVTRGLLVTVGDVVFLIIFTVDLANFYWLPIQLCTSKFHVITMLAMLNARPSTNSRGHAASGDRDSFHIDTRTPGLGITSILRGPEFASQSMQTQDSSNDGADGRKNM